MANEIIEWSKGIHELQNAFLDIKIKPVPGEAVLSAEKCRYVFFFEEGVRSAGIGEKFALLLLERGFGGSYKLTAVGDCFVKQSNMCNQIKKYGLDADSMVVAVLGKVKREFSV